MPGTEFSRGPSSSIAIASSKGPGLSHRGTPQVAQTLSHTVLLSFTLSFTQVKKALIHQPIHVLTFVPTSARIVCQRSSKSIPCSQSMNTDAARVALSSGVRAFPRNVHLVSPSLSHIHIPLFRRHSAYTSSLTTSRTHLHHTGSPKLPSALMSRGTSPPTTNSSLVPLALGPSGK
ncbi:unnamed protein product [Trypanosoma congolense IL3000]|uniref:WGS project CAEQ00000000 data, annotated contig 1090 n=1 Tax=Trypanosoma congolense (strain IL3000) TaxID=1068625 RepID=F9W3Q4_TRYCI|nr:unnamed protein product [Trypanosoma congolense IL3000]